MLSDEKLTELLAALPAIRVTEEYIRSRIERTEYVHVGATMTICVLTLDNGYVVTGESACVSPENFSVEIGQTLAYKHAFNKLWPLFGFLLAEQLRLAGKSEP